MSNNSASEVEAILLAHGPWVAEPPAQGDKKVGGVRWGKRAWHQVWAESRPAEKEGADGQGDEEEGNSTAAGPDEVQPIQHVSTRTTNKLPIQRRCFLQSREEAQVAT